MASLSKINYPLNKIVEELSQKALIIIESQTKKTCNFIDDSN